MLAENLVLDLLREVLKAQQDNNLLLDGLAKSLAKLGTQETDIMADLSSLEADVKANGDAVASAVTLLQGLKAQLDAAGTDAAKLADLSASIEANTSNLAAAVAANTPAAAPTPVPPSVPTP